MSVDFVEAKQVGTASGYRSAKGLTIATMILLGLHALMSLVLSISLSSTIKVLDASNTDTLSSGRVGLGDALAAIVFGVGYYLQVAVSIACAVCFLCWLYRCYANLPSLGSDRLTTPGSAVGGWFIPFVNFVHGYRSVHELYLESQRPAVLPDGYVLPARAGIVGFWWAAFLGRVVISRIADKMIDTEQASSLQWFWATAAIDFAAAILCMMVVYRVDKRQRDQHQDLVRRQAAPVPTGSTLR
jgi:hypothetical protein